MPIRATVQTIEGDAPAGRRAPRHRILLDAELRSPSGDARDVVVRNISATGILLETEFPLEQDEVLELVLPETGVSEARIVWADGRLYGCEFIEPITSAALSAAQLKSGVEDARSDEGPTEEAAPSFGAWLKTLRERQGLSSSKLADLAGVSKVTLWNWESDNAKPQPKNLSRLASALETSERHLLNGWQGDADHGDRPSPRAEGSGSRSSPSTERFPRKHSDERLAEMILASKSQIAELAGTTNDKVRIIIEF